MKTYYNEALDIIVRFGSDEGAGLEGGGLDFVVIGDDEKVSDNTLLALSTGSLPEGWVKSNG